MGNVRSLPSQERPREKAMRYGVRKLSNRELLAILIRCGTKRRSALEVADSILLKAEGIRGLERIGMEELQEIKGISHVKALELFAALELARRVTFEKAREMDVVKSPDMLYVWLQQKLGGEMQEKFLVLFLDQAHHIQRAETLFAGTAQETTVSPKDIFRVALRYACTAIVLVHNHPGGSLAPSKADLAMTRRIMYSGALMGIRVLDHIIVTKNGCMSFAKEGVLEVLQQQIDQS